MEGPPDVGSAAADEALALPLPGLSGDWSEAGKRSGLAVLQC